MPVIRVALIALLAAVIALPAAAAEKTLDGTLVCAMCGLKKEGVKECQDVLVVADASGAKAEYYITKNDVAKKAGEACMTEVKATVTGTVSEKDGKTWLTPSKIEKHGAAGGHPHNHAH